MMIRAMELRDIEAVAEIEIESFSSPWTSAAFLKELEENKIAHYLVAVEGDNLLGYIGMWKIMDEGHITNIAVSLEQRGRGVGRALLSELIAEAKLLEIESMTLEVRESNLVAQALYRSQGFESAGIRPKYYDNGEAAVIMWLQLN